MRSSSVLASLCLWIVLSPVARADGRLCARDEDCGSDGACPSGTCVYGAQAAAARKAEGAMVPPAVAPAATPAVPTQRRWYGWQILVGDSATAALGLTLAFTTGDRREFGWVLLMPLGGPVVHAAHGHPLRALGSLAMNVLLPVGATVALATAAGPCTNDNPDACLGSGLATVFFGIVGGAATAIAIDTAVLAYDDVPVAPASSHASGWTITPAFAPLPGGLSAGVAGAF